MAKRVGMMSEGKVNPEPVQGMLFLAFTREELTEILEGIELDYTITISPGGTHIDVDIDVDKLAGDLIKALEALND